MQDKLADFEFDPNNLITKQEYLDNHACAYFKRTGTVEPFIKKHKRELVTTGSVHVQRGPGGTLINHPRFNDIASQIIEREARAYAMPYVCVEAM